jgi:hypothetical protein
MEEWVVGADDLLAKFGDMIEMVSRSFLACALGLLFGFPMPLLADQGPYEVRSLSFLLYHRLR